jgi:hypothetical protein
MITPARSHKHPTTPTTNHHRNQHPQPPVSTS